MGEKRISRTQRIGALWLAFALFLPPAFFLPAPAQAIVELRHAHAHGLGYSADGSRILPNGEIRSGALPIEEVRRLLDESSPGKR